MYDTKTVLKRFKAAQKRKSNWEDTYEEALEFFTPQFETFTTQQKGSDERGQGRIFDSTGESSIQKFVSNLQSSLVPPMKRWIQLKPGKEVQGDVEEAAKALEDITDILFSHLSNSNFDTQVAESFFDLAVGTGALMVQKGDRNNPFRFTAAPLNEIYTEEGAHSRVNAVFRKFKMPHRVIELTWPDAKISRELQDQITTNPDKEIELIESTIPAKVKVTQKSTGKKIEVDGYKYIVMDAKGNEKLVERDSESSPWVIFRWAVRPGEIYGRGPALQALSDVKTINKTKELILKNGSMAVAGAYTVADDGIINVRNIRIKPGALIPVSDNPGGVRGPTIAPLPRTGDFNVGQLILQDLKTSINEMMFADPLGPVDLPVKTATEVAIRQQELAKRIGSAFGRLQFELITPLINRLLFILEDLDLINLNDFRVDGRFISIEHISPLAQAQDQEELVSIERMLGLLGQTFGPQLALMMLQPSELVSEIQELLNVRRDITAPPEQIQAMIQNILSQGQQEQPQ